MKKILLIALVVILIALGAFYFFWSRNGNSLSDFFSEGADFGSFFDVDPQSRNDFAETPSATTTDSGTPQANGEFVAPVLRQISFEPVSGFTSYGTTSTSTRQITSNEGLVQNIEFQATSTAIRFQERATGHIYDVFEFIPSPQKVSNFTVQKVYRSIFSNKDTFLGQTLSPNHEQVRTNLNRIVYSTTTTPTLSQSDVSSTISNFMLNAAANKLVYSVTQNGVTGIFTSNFDRTGEKLATNVPFSEFLLDPINATDVLVTMKASQSVPGYSYILNTSTGSLTKILGNLPGLTAKVSPNKKFYIYTATQQTRPVTNLYNVDTGSTIKLALDTLSEKCIFSEKDASIAYCFGALIYQSASYPDDWYKGKVFNSDSLYRISLTDGYAEQIYNFSADGFAFDAINPRLTFNDELMVFMDKYTLTLWAIDLVQVANQVF